MVDLEPYHALIHHVTSRLARHGGGDGVDIGEAALLVAQQQPKQRVVPVKQSSKPARRITVDLRRRQNDEQQQQPPPPPSLSRRRIDVQHDPAHVVLIKTLPLLFALRSRQDMALQMALQTCGGMLALRDPSSYEKQDNPTLYTAVASASVMWVFAELEYDAFVCRTFTRAIAGGREYANQFQEAVMASVGIRATKTIQTMQELCAVVIVSSIVSESMSNSQQTMLNLSREWPRLFASVASLIPSDSPHAGARAMFTRGMATCTQAWHDTNRLLPWREAVSHVFPMAWNIVMEHVASPNNNNVLLHMLFACCVFASSYNMERGSCLGHERMTSTVVFASGLVPGFAHNNSASRMACVVCVRAVDQLWERFRSCKTLRVPNSWLYETPIAPAHYKDVELARVARIVSSFATADKDLGLVLHLRCRAAVTVLDMLFPPPPPLKDNKSDMEALLLMASNVPSGVSLVRRRMSLNVANPSVLETVRHCDRVLRSVMPITVKTPPATTTPLPSPVFQDWTTSSSSWESSLDDEQEEHLRRLTDVRHALTSGRVQGDVERMMQNMWIPSESIPLPGEDDDDDEEEDDEDDDEEEFEEEEG